MDIFNYFEDFLKIPRGSGNEKKISNYLVEFAKSNNLEYYVDDFYNVIIKRNSNCNSKEVIILQGHMDMVCTSVNNYDFKNNGIDWFIEDGFYKARGTTLGADNGIGCSIILSLLSNSSIKVPNIEAIFTVEEETSMLGAKKLDYSKITGNKLISIDGTDEGVIEVSSAGMVSIELSKNIEYIDNIHDTYKITVDGLLGGHSGTDISKNRGNSIKIMMELLKQLNNYDIVSIDGGSKENVIPSACECIITTSEPVNIENIFKQEYPMLNINVSKIEKSAKIIKPQIKNTIIKVINNLPTGVLTYKRDFPQTSLNLGVIETTNTHFSMKISIRSSNEKDEEDYISIVKQLSKGLDYNLVDRKPFFSYKKNSPLRELLIKEYEKLFENKVELRAVHAGLEGGIFAEKIKDLDICVIAPNLYDIHTVNERVEIDSVNRVYLWLKNVLENI